ncbi:ABC transporter ATP-binding protein [Paraburkholderia flagellata]|uniref:ABC transporter ATP-binding protein n=1 Tax=Paraburkholderia flagellata TaxID=2883241 RepID=UPI001F3EFA8E|nr:ABC transporter ATP-binding protein [Paraburkholderia flagellata]
MIIVENVHKRYQGEHGAGKWILNGVNITIPSRHSVALIGRNGAGKSTLLRIIGGIDFPTKGRVQRRCKVSWPMGGAGLEGTLTGRQNAKFVCRIHGHQDELADRIAYIQDFAELGESFDEPVQTYSSGMRSRLQFAMSLAFNFEVYISDEVTAAGDAKFRKKAAEAFKNKTDQASVIMVSHDENTLKQFCQSAIWIHNGQAHWFDDLEDGMKAYKDNLLA